MNYPTEFFEDVLAERPGRSSNPSENEMSLKHKMGVAPGFRVRSHILVGLLCSGQRLLV